LYDKVGGGGTRELLHQTQEQFQQVWENTLIPKGVNPVA
jgi:hypothetical protein